MAFFGKMEGKGTPFGNRLQLYSERGYLLKISDNGEILGTQDSYDSNTHLKVLSGENIGLVKIKGLQSGFYICFDENGALYGERSMDQTGSTFKECFAGSYNCYECADHPGWFIGISKKGEAKNGNRTLQGKKSTKFLPVRIE